MMTPELGGSAPVPPGRRGPPSWGSVDGVWAMDWSPAAYTCEGVIRGQLSESSAWWKRHGALTRRNSTAGQEQPGRNMRPASQWQWLCVCLCVCVCVCVCVRVCVYL